jgi:hypothetical protein
MVPEKGMRVINFASDQHRETPLDVFATEPFEFSAEHAEGNRRAQHMEFLALPFREKLRGAGGTSRAPAGAASTPGHGAASSGLDTGF